ncbi:hypothetical protein [Flagellimonas sp.]|uniref:hypothetical protein n=1 Tax=Flagellimonas sp. TaxID=2058762 RepID=UPI003B50829B
MNKKKLIVGISIFGIIVFGVLMNRANSGIQEDYFNDPKVGDIYVFDNLLRNEGYIGQNLFKIQKVSEEFVYFYKPNTKWPLKSNLDPDIIRKSRTLDEQGEMYLDEVVKLSKIELTELKNSNSFSHRTKNPNGSRLVKIYR